MGLATKLAAGSLAVGVLVLLLKLAAWWLTGSVALLSDALESTVNIATAFAAFAAIKYAARPPDTGHPYGHHKAEYLSAVLEGAMIAVAAIVILMEAWDAWRQPRMIAPDHTGFAINALASAINAAWAFILIRQGKALRSPALAADGRHLLTDVFSSAVVLSGILLAIALSQPALDPLLAVFVAVNTLVAGWRVMSDSIGALMDRAAPAELQHRIREVIAANTQGALQVHDLRTRLAGQVTFIDFHLVVDGAMSVSTSHAICDRIENALKTGIEGAAVTIHVEPPEKAKTTNVVEPGSRAASR